MEEPSENSSPWLAMDDFDGRGTMLASERVTSHSSVRHRLVSRELGTGHKFYAVRRGRTPLLYFSWADCSRQVTCHKGTEHKSFWTLAEAEEYLFRGEGF
jgi:hypothetical protein